LSAFHRKDPAIKKIRIQAFGLPSQSQQLKAKG
jgi:hypothetical protein